MLTFVLAAALAAEDPLPPPPPPPPLVPQQGEALPPPPPPPLYSTNSRDRDPDAEVDEAEQDIQEMGFSGARVAVTGAVAGATGALFVSAALLFAFNVRGAGSAGLLLGLLSLPTSLFVGTAVAVSAHRALGGRGGYGAHLGGGAIGGAVALVFTTIAFLYVAPTGNPGVGILAGWVSGAALLFGAGTGLMAELSNWRTMRELRERRAAFSVAPVRGGAVVLAGFSF